MQKMSGRLADHARFREDCAMALFMLPFSVGMILLFLRNPGGEGGIFRGYAAGMGLLFCIWSLRKIETYHLTWAIAEDGCAENRWGRIRRRIPISRVQFFTQVTLPCYFGSRYGYYLARYFVLSDHPIPHFWHISGPGFGSLWHFWWRHLILLPVSGEVSACLEAHGLSPIPQYPRVGCCVRGEKS